MANAGDFRNFSEWTPEEKAEFLLFTGATYIDFSQTTWAMRQRDANGNSTYYEINPILGKHPSNESVAIMSILGVAYYYYLIGSESDHRLFSIISRSSMFSVKAVAILHNDSVGISISKAW